MKATLATLALVTLMITSTAAWAGVDSTSSKLPPATSFSARISEVVGDTLHFIILNPAKDKVIVKVYSDRNVKVMQTSIGRKEAVHVTYLMENMRKAKYTAIVERNDQEVARKVVTLK